MSDIYEIRCPIHGFVQLDRFEMDLLSHPYFQRLRRIRQLAWTDLVYPGAMHTRFEHSLGVMHVATLMFDELWKRRENELIQLGFTKANRERDRAVLRAVALLHDIGHSPFSHAGEGPMPAGPGGKPHKHEQYSSALIRRMADLIDNHPAHKYGFQIKAAEIADMLDRKASAGFANLFWRELMSGQLDADRADYLLRDSHHTGVQYGKFDLNRLLISLTVARDPETENPVLAVEEGGWHTAEALILARYMMFSQVYFHKTRSIYDHHFSEAMQVLLAHEQKDSDLAEKSKFPPPDSEKNLDRYFEWDDWRVLALLRQGVGGEKGDILLKRNHYRLAYESGSIDAKVDQEVPTNEKKRFEIDQKNYDAVKAALGALVAHEDPSDQLWYKVNSEITIAMGPGGQVDRRLVPLSELSLLVKALRKEQVVKRLYVRNDDRKRAEELVEKALAKEAEERKKAEKAA